MSTDAEDQADEAASLEAIFGDDVELNTSTSTYKVSSLGQQQPWQQGAKQTAVQLLSSRMLSCCY